MTTLYLDCFAGIAGDMTVAALLDLGASREKLESVLATLPVSGFRIKVSRVEQSGLDCCDFNVILDHDNHDHDMSYLHDGQMGYDYGEGDGHSREHVHGNEHDHDHACSYDYAYGHEFNHAHRGINDIVQIIDSSAATPRAKTIAKRIFEIIAQAESKAHGIPADQVRFHEVGALDSIVDIVAVAVCVDDLNVIECIVSPLSEGTGTVRTQHGVLPVPVPAVANIIEQHGLSMSIMSGVKGEFVTPTGAAIAAALRTEDRLPAVFKVKRTGLGAGKRTYECPSILRAMLIEPQEHGATDLLHPHLWKLETEVDDCPAEALGYLLERLYDAGAREAHFIPAFMKKNRPGYQIEILCDEAVIPELENVLFQNTTTIGVRRSPLWRTALPRECSVVETELGEVGVKRVVLPDGEVRSYPEHDAIARIARERGVSYQDVLRAVFRQL
ncbi:MAG: nickel pincer cofactor biosynthesis protein LarC [Eggerthellaceae bacterium]|nr:nickel pincer cofactor biosynthesis protein LarC [Eggerthellaceae bacterium]